MNWEMGESGRKLCGVAIVALVVLAGGHGSGGALVPVNSNSIVQDGIEYYIQTDKAIYDLEEDVEILYRVTNLRDENVTFHFSDQVQYYFEITDNGGVIWFSPKVGLPATSSFVLQPKGYKEYRETWDMINENGTPWLPEDDFSAIPGSYEITGSLHPIALSLEDIDKYVPVSAQVEIIPEPTSLLLLGSGLAGLLSRRKR